MAHILVVDDDPDIRELVSLKLQASGHTTVDHRVSAMQIKSRIGTAMTHRSTQPGAHPARVRGRYMVTTTTVSAATPTNPVT